MVGDFAEHESRQALSGASLELPALSLIAHWHRCGMTADWLAGFMAYDFEHRESASNVLATVVNELLENAAKFCAGSFEPVGLSVRHYGDEVRVEVRNCTEAKHAEALRSHLARLEEEDPDGLFASLVERAGEPGSPGVGLLLLRRNYGAAIAVRADPPDGDRPWLIRIQTTLPAEELENQ